jgi:glycosyltransferase involved in cell wall biosynthesis
MAGDGSQLNECRRFAMNRLHDQVIFHSPWPAQETAVVLGSADLLLLPTRGGQSLASVPSKLISYMLAARPVLAQAISGSETARLVRESKCGWVIDPDDPELLEDQIRSVVAMNSSELVRRGIAGRDYAEKHLSKEACLRQLVEIILNASKHQNLSTHV